MTDTLERQVSNAIYACGYLTGLQADTIARGILDKFNVSPKGLSFAELTDLPLGSKVLDKDGNEFTYVWDESEEDNAFVRITPESNLIVKNEGWFFDTFSPITLAENKED